MTENKNTNNICPGCGRGCSLDNPHCPRGEEYARSGSIAEGHSHSESHRDHPHDHPHGPRSEHGPHGPGAHAPHGMPPHGPRHKPPHYESMDSSEKLLYLLGKLSHQSHRAFGGKSAQHHILHLLQKDGGMTQRELTERLGIQPGSASEILKKLETAGCIRRSPSETDRRTTDVRLTEEGAAQVQAQEEERKERKSELLSALTEEETLQLLNLLEKLSADWDRRHPHGHPHGPPMVTARARRTADALEHKKA